MDEGCLIIVNDTRYTSIVQHLQGNDIINRCMQQQKQNSCSYPQTRRISTPCPRTPMVETPVPIMFRGRRYPFSSVRAHSNPRIAKTNEKTNEMLHGWNKVLSLSIRPTSVNLRESDGSASLLCLERLTKSEKSIASVVYSDVQSHSRSFCRQFSH